MSARFEPITPQAITWRDGEPYATHFDDIYFSSEDGLGESHEVFCLGNHLAARWQVLNERATFTIGELGFGSGLNCLLAWRLWLEVAPPTATLIIYSTEKYPLTQRDLIQALKRWPTLKREADLLCDAYPILTPGMHTLVFEEGRVVLHLMLEDALLAYKNLLCSGDAKLESQLRTWHVDAWFLDGFAPSKNQDMWSEELFRVIGLLSQEGSTVATFSVAKCVRSALEAAGFTLLRKAGFGKKRHRLEGVLKTTCTVSIKKRQTPWFIEKPREDVPQKAIVIGAGLAGAFTAHGLVQKGFEVVVMDREHAVAKGASNNTQAVLYPNLSAYRAPLTTWLLQAFLYASKTYANWLKAGVVEGELDGILQLDVNAKTHTLHASLKPWLQHYPALGVLLDAEEASNLAGVSVASDALFIPEAGWINSRGLCEFLMQSPNITFKPDTPVDELSYEQGLWHVAGDEAPVVVLANGYGVAQFEQTQHLPVTLFRGQMTAVKPTALSSAIKRPICGVGHVLPKHHNAHWVGASYHQGVQDRRLDDVDDKANLAKLHALPINTDGMHEVQDHWAGVRAKTPDYLPLVGPVPNVADFATRFAGLSRDGAKFIAEPGAYYPGLYVCAGFGSRGLTSIPLAAHYLTSLISQTPTPLSSSVAESLAPARIHIKNIKQYRSCYKSNFFNGCLLYDNHCHVHLARHHRLPLYP